MKLRNSWSEYAHEPMIPRLRTRSGRAKANSCAIAPPIEKPITCVRMMPSSSQSAMASAAMSGTVNSPSGSDERPTPRLSTTVTRYCSLKGPTCASQADRSSPSPQSSRTSSPSPSWR